MTQENTTSSPTQTSSRKLLIGGGIAAAIAAGALVLFILPSEFGIDPTGAGKAMGLTALTPSGEMTELERGALRDGKVLTLSNGPITTDRWEYELEPFTSIEFKYTMDEGAGMLFKWEASGPLHYDMHSHPFEGGTELTESYGVGDAQKIQGTYVAPFTGIHGWYWQNQTSDTVKFVVEATGGLKESTIFDQFGEHERPLVAPE